MPILAGLGDIIFAALAMLLGAALILLAVVLGVLLGHVPGVGGWISDHVQSYLTDAGHALINLSKSAWKLLGDLFHAYAYLWHNTVGKMLTATWHVANNILHINTTVIPQTRSDAFGHADSLATSLQHNIDTNRGYEQDDVHSLQSNIDGVRNYVDTTYDDKVTHEISSAKEGAVTTSEGYTDHSVAVLAKSVNDTLAQVWDQLDALTQTVIPTINAEIIANATKEQQDVAAARQQEMADIQSARSDLSSQIQAASAAQSEALANVKAGLDTEINQQAATQAAALIAEAQSQDAKLQAAQLTLQGQITTAEAQETSYTDQVAATLGLSIAGLITQVASLTNEIKSCMVTTCDGPNNWQNLLQQALGVASLAEVASFLAQAVKDPVGTSSALAEVGTDTYNAGHALLDSLLSI